MPDDNHNEFPDFKSMSDFTHWVDNLPDGQIQSWQTKDWLGMYDKLFRFIDESPELEKFIPDYLSSIDEKHPAENLSTYPLRQIRRNIFRKSPEGISSLIKLYKNYRIEPKHQEQIKKLALEAGEKAAAITEIKSSNLADIDKDSLEHIVRKLEDIVYEQTTYPDLLESMGKNRDALRAKISVFDDGFENGYATPGHPIPQVNIRLGKDVDVKLETILHELAHAHLQTTRYLSKNKTIREHKPVKNIDASFSRLMIYNKLIYLKYDNVLKAYTHDENQFQSRSEYINTGRSLYKNNQAAFTASVIQPLEYFAYIYGRIAQLNFCKTRNLPLQKDPYLRKYGNCGKEYR